MTFPKTLGGAMTAPSGAEDVPVGSPEDGWSDERVAALRQLALLGCSAGRVALLLGGVTRGAVLGKASRLGLTFRAQAPQGQRTKGELKVAPRLPRRRGQPVVVPGSAAGLGRCFGAGRPAKAPGDRGADDRAAVDAGAFPHAVALERIRPGQCRYPLWRAEDAADLRLFCGAGRRDAKTPYCAAHMAIAYQRPAERRAA